MFIERRNGERRIEAEQRNWLERRLDTRRKFTEEVAVDRREGVEFRQLVRRSEIRRTGFDRRRWPHEFGFAEV
jgi:hypothetical protein